MSFWKKKDNLIITSLVIAFFIGLTVWYEMCCLNASFFPASTSMNSFEIPFIDENQKELTLDRFKGKPLILNFWATWCPVCVKKMGSLNDFAKKFQEKGGQVLAISQDRGGLSVVRAFYARNDYKNLDLYLDATGHLLDSFGARGLPTAIFIDAQGREVDRIEGGFDWDSSEISAIIQKHFGINMTE